MYPCSMTNQETKSRVVLLFGGVSGEHSVSCATAAGVLRAIDRDRYDVVPIGITESGDWIKVPDDPSVLEGGEAKVSEVGLAESHIILDQTTGRFLDVVGDSLKDLGRPDVVMPLLHGPFGEDGTIQGLFEIANLKYVGPGVLASALGMDKHYTKMVMRDAGLPVARQVLVTKSEFDNDSQSLLDECESLGLPVFVKPCRAGSSLGVERVASWDALEAAILRAHQHDPRVLVEEAIAGREIECAVIGGRENRGPRVAPLGEVVMQSEDSDFYDFETKYFDTEGFSMECPANLPSDVSEQIQRAAKQAFDALTCEGLTRVDFFLQDNGSFVVNEVNTLPGFTPYSMFPLMWSEGGLSYTELVTELLELALERPVGLR